MSTLKLNNAPANISISDALLFEANGTSKERAERFYAKANPKLEQAEERSRQNLYLTVLATVKEASLDSWIAEPAKPTARRLMFDQYLELNIPANFDPELKSYDFVRPLPHSGSSIVISFIPDIYMKGSPNDLDRGLFSKPLDALVKERDKTLDSDYQAAIVFNNAKGFRKFAVGTDARVLFHTLVQRYRDDFKQLPWEGQD